MSEIHYAVTILDMDLDPSALPDRISPDLRNLVLGSHYVKLEHAAMRCVHDILEHREKTGKFLAMAIVACEGDEIRPLNRDEDALLGELQKKMEYRETAQRKICRALDAEFGFH